MSNKNKYLVIVESPAKCKKIESLLGKDYICKASFGHIKKLTKVDIENDFKPTYETIKHMNEKAQDHKKEKNLIELKKISSQCMETIIASDLDREGEAIGYNLIEELKLNPKTTKRILFNEITKASLQKAIKNPTTIDMDLYQAQQTRSILDMIIGFQLSPLLQKFIQKGLSAGRVQSPSLKILCDRENKIASFDSDKYYKITATFLLNSNESEKKIKKGGNNSDADTYDSEDEIEEETNNKKKKGSNDTNTLESVLDTTIENKKDTIKFLNNCSESTFKIKNIKSSDSNRNPPAPFITSTLQQEASKVHGVSPKLCMSMAQKLYENGLITYMRTDSIQLSTKALEDIKTYIINAFGEKYYTDRKFKNKSENSQEAHEAIRPTDITNINIADKIDDKMTQKIYSLIWKRTIACQMTAMKININKINISISKEKKHTFITTINNILFDGYTKVYKNDESKVDTEQNTVNVSKLSDGDKLDYEQITGTEDWSKPSPRLTEADLIKELEKKGIGRPSTFSSMVSLIQDRGYVEKKSSNGKQADVNILALVKKKKNIIESQKTKLVDEYKNRLTITNIGKEVNDFLDKHFNNIINYTFTSQLENDLDVISTGKMKWKQLISNTYNIFAPKVKELRAIAVSGDDRLEKNRKSLGKSTDEKKTVYITKLKNGWVVAESDPTGEKTYSKFASVPSNLDTEEITLEKANELLKYPYTLGTHDNKDIIINNGMYGHYIKYDGKNYSLNSEQMADINIKKAVKIIDDKKSGLSNGKSADIIKELSDDIIIKKGKTKDDKQMPDYILHKTGKTSSFISISGNIDSSKITLKEAKELIKAHKDKKGGGKTTTYKKNKTKE